MKTYSQFLKESTDTPLELKRKELEDLAYQIYSTAKTSGKRTRGSYLGSTFDITPTADSYRVEMTHPPKKPGGSDTWRDKSFSKKKQSTWRELSDHVADSLIKRHHSELLPKKEKETLSNDALMVKGFLDHNKKAGW